jgi:hypothetical protein
VRQFGEAKPSPNGALGPSAIPGRRTAAKNIENNPMQSSRRAPVDRHGCGMFFCLSHSRISPISRR